jgi:hypothetical protein
MAPLEMTPNDEAIGFVLLCLRGRRQPECRTAACGLAHSGDIDWDGVQTLAKDEGLEPLLLSVLGGQGVLPAAVEARWRQVTFRYAGRNTLIAQELADVLQQLGGAGAPAIVLKGAALAVTVYEEPSLRPMTDLDLLLRRDDVPRALQALQAAGYETPVPELGLDGALEYANELVLHRPGGLEIPVELHWGLFDSPFYDRRELEAWLWETAVPGAMVPGRGEALPTTLERSNVETLERWGTSPQRARILGPEAQILHLCGHRALHHAGQGLLWLNDIAEIVAHYGDRIDWGMLARQAETFDLVLPLREALPRVAEGWGAAIPAATRARLQAAPVSPGEARAFRWMTEPDGGVALEVWSDLAGLSGPAGRARYLVKKLFPSPAYMRQRYSVEHAALLPLYYPYRWWLGLRSARARAVGVVRSQRREPVP